MTVVYPFPFFSGEVKIGLVNALACLFTSAIKLRLIVYEHLNLLLKIILEHKWNLKQYLSIYEFIVMDESTHLAPSVRLRKRKY